MADRCGITDLLAAECAHCRRIPDPGQESEVHRTALTITANYAGECADCGDGFPAGATITADPDRYGWVAECCMEGGPDALL